MRKDMSRSDKEGISYSGSCSCTARRKGAVCCPVLFKLPPEGANAESRAEPTPELFVLAQYLQTTLQPGDHDCESGFLDLLLQPVSHVIDNAGPLNVDEMLEFIECQEAYAAAFDEFPQANALADGIATAFQFYRITRNEVGHPEIVPNLQKPVLHAQIAQMTVYLERIYGLIAHFQTNGVVL